jgi:hypothetical protein
VPPETLDRELGRTHLRYEVRMLVCHARTLLSRPGGLPGDVLGFPNPAWDAVLEAWLVHFRVLDEFLRFTGPHKGNAYARQWLKQWPSGGGFLGRRDREAIDHQVVHLHAKRRAANEWKVRELTESACAKLVEFCDAVRSNHPERYDLLAETRCFAEKFLNATLGPDDCACAPAYFGR